MVGEQTGWGQAGFLLIRGGEELPSSPPVPLSLPILPHFRVRIDCI